LDEFAILSATLAADGMTVANLVKVTTYLASRDHAELSRASLPALCRARLFSYFG
jgi:hypothetical protein